MEDACAVGKLKCFQLKRNSRNKGSVIHQIPAKKNPTSQKKPRRQTS